MGNVRAGGAYVELFANDARLRDGLARAQARLQRWGGAVSALGSRLSLMGGVGLAGIVGALKHFTDAGSAVNDMSERTGIGTDALQVLGMAAAQAGGSMEDVEAGIRKMQVAIHAANSGSKEAAGLFKQLGISAKELQGLSPDQQFARLADAFATIEDPAKRTAMTVAVFGRSGTKLAEVLKGGSAGIAEMAREAERLGLIMSAEDVLAADELGDRLGVLKQQMLGVGNSIAAALAPAVTSMVKALQPVIAAIRGWIKENPGLVQAIGAAVVGTLGFGLALIVVGKSITLFGAMLPILRMVTTQFALYLITTAIPALLNFAFAMLAVLGPIGLLTGALGLGIIALMAGPQILAASKASFGEILQTARDTIGGIGDAIAAGDIPLAFSIAAAGAKLAWVQFKGWWQAMLQALGIDANNLRGLLENIWTGLGVAWVELTSFMQSTWSAASRRIAHGMLLVGNLFTDLSEEMAALEAGGREEQTALQQNRRNRLGQIARETEARKKALADQVAVEKAARDEEMAGARQALFDAAQEAAMKRAGQVGQAAAAGAAARGIGGTTVGGPGTFNAAAIQGLLLPATAAKDRQEDLLGQQLDQLKMLRGDVGRLGFQFE